MGSFLEKYDSCEWEDVAKDLVGVLKNVKRYLVYPECNNLLGVRTYNNEETKKKALKRINKLIRDFIK